MTYSITIVAGTHRMTGALECADICKRTHVAHDECRTILETVTSDDRQSLIDYIEYIDVSGYDINGTSSSPIYNV